MHIIINLQKLNTAIKNVERIVSKNISLPILNTILIKTEKGGARLSATNLELGLNYWVGAKIEKEGEIAVPARIISSFLSNINDEKITLIAENNTLKISSDYYKTKVLCFDTKDFPIIPKVKRENIIKINSLTLKNGLLSVIDSTLMSETRPELAGIYININGNKIEFAATDSFRLSEKITSIGTNNLKKQFIIPKNTSIEIIRLMDGSEGDVNLTVSDNQIVIFNEDFELISRLVDGHYPDYKKIIPDKTVSVARFNKANFEKNIRTAGIFSSSIYDVKLKVNGEKTEINAQNNDRGELVANIPSELKNKPFEVLLNYNYLLDGLKNIPTENVIMHYTGDGSPLLLKPENQNDYVYLIMPLRS
ncbi:MAG: DNA polymerase III subunit beta [bacterium]|nr:DNA polymerase III subunit beta [bacterium]